MTPDASLWGGSIPKSTWKEFENVQKHFLTKFLQVKETNTIHPPPREGDHFPLRSWPWKGLLNTRKVQKSPSHRLPRILCSSWIQDMEKMVW